MFGILEYKLYIIIYQYQEHRIYSFAIECRLLITFANSLDPDQARQVEPDLGLSLLTLWWYSWKIFRKVDFPKNQHMTKTHEKFPSRANSLRNSPALFLIQMLLFWTHSHMAPVNKHIITVKLSLKFFINYSLKHLIFTCICKLKFQTIFQIFSSQGNHRYCTLDSFSLKYLVKLKKNKNFLLVWNYPFSTLFVLFFVCVNSLIPCQHFFSHAETGLPGFNHY